MTYRSYNPDVDEKAVIRIWQECGWPDPNKKELLKPFQDFLGGGTADVAEYDGEAECLVTTHSGSMNMLDTALPFRAVSCVTVGRRLRRLGAAGELTARAVMRAAEDGDALAGLGIFDQGFYNKLGFGNFPYIHTIALDPLSLKVPGLERPPVRLTAKDISRIDSNMSERLSHHGLVRIPGKALLGMNMAEAENGFGLGFEDKKGKLTHHFWAKPKGESGPYDIWWMVYRNYTELIELMSLIKNLGDQVYTVTLREPWGIQIQDLLIRPFRTREISGEGSFRNEMKAASWKQARILNMESVLAALRLPFGRIQFNLELTDPIEKYLSDDADWKGLGGSWTVTLAETGSSATRNKNSGAADLPVMTATVNAFTRLVFGVTTAAGLAATDNLSAPSELLKWLDDHFRMPRPEMVCLF